MSSLTPAQKFDGVMALIGGFSLHLTLGTLYCFGNMNTYMTSYLRKHVNPDIVYSDMIWIPTLATIGQGMFMTLSGYMEELVGVRFTILLGSACMTSGVYLTSYAIQTSLLMTIFTYGFMFGLGLAMAYAPPMGVAMKWFPKQKGLVNGVIVGGFGMGAFVFNQIQATYLNPRNEALDDDGYFSDDLILNRVPSVFLLLGSIYGVIQAMSVLLISSPSSSDESSMLPLVSHAVDGQDEEGDAEEEESLVMAEEEANDGGVAGGGVNDDEDDGDDDDALSNGDPRPNGHVVDGGDIVESRRQRLNNSNSASGLSVSLGHPDNADNLKPGQMVRSREFWILWCTFFLNTQAITYINSMYKAYGQTFIRDDHFLAVVGAFAAVFNASGRIFWGHLCDVHTYRTCMAIVTVMIAGFYSTFCFVPAVAGGKAMFAAWVWAIFFCFCANFVLLPTAAAQCFGTKYASKNYGLVMTGQAFASLVTALLTQHLSPVFGWEGMFLVIAAFSLACTALTVQFPKQPSPKAILQRLKMTPSVL